MCCRTARPSKMRRGEPSVSSMVANRAKLSRRDSRYGFRGVRVGEASHPGPPRRYMSRPIEGRDVTPRMQLLDRAIQVDDSNDAHVHDFPVRELRRLRRVRRRVSTDNDAPAVARGSRFTVLTQRDRESDEEPLVRPTGQRNSRTT